MSERPSRRIAPDRLPALALAAAPRAGETRILAIDGRSGAGKSTLGELLSRQMNAPCISLEQLYGGWDGLQAGIDRLLRDVLTPLAGGRAAAVPRYDWVAGHWLAPQTLEPPPLLIVEGVGAGARAAAPHISLLAWLELSEPQRRRRATQRDGSLYEGHWEMWRAQEDAYLAANRTAERADVIVAGEDVGG
jgi:uridine kinase